VAYVLLVVVLAILRVDIRDLVGLVTLLPGTGFDPGGPAGWIPD
jgi:hypothetical protein